MTSTSARTKEMRLVETGGGLGALLHDHAREREIMERDLQKAYGERDTVRSAPYVDDVADARELVKMALESCGARTLSAASAAEGLRVLADRRPDVLLSDIGMPDEDGHEFLRRVRQLSPDQGGLIPAAVVTAYAAEGDRRSALGSGFQAFIAKPAHPAELVAIVAQLAARASEREH
jgi:CheY-like chemotaxis protein